MKRVSQFLKTAVFLLSLHVVGLLLMSLFRLIEFFCLHGMIVEKGASVLQAFLRGLWFDNVVGCYILILPMAVLLIAALLGQVQKGWRQGAVIWYDILLGIVLMTSAANIPYFHYFLKNINASIFGWFGYAGTTAGMVFQEKSWWGYILLYFISLSLLIYANHRIQKVFNRWIGQQTTDSHSWGSYTTRGVITVALLALCLLGIRGRTGYNPIKISEAYYCDDPFLNQLGISPSFNLLTSALDDMRKENQELHLMPYPQAISFARQSLNITGHVDSLDVLRRQVTAEGAPKKYNVVIILMESMSGKLMQTFGQQEHLTPTLDSLYHHSLAFMNYYSAGTHTNIGITATLYSFPALMSRNLMKGTVTPHREGIPTVLHAAGYRNSFFMTHEAQYDNMNAFLRTNGYDDIYSQEDYPRSQRVNAFGVSDHFLFDYALGKINAQARKKGPWMATLLTISNHPPYVVPSFFHPKTKKPETQIVEYADWAIGDFLRKARREPWYKNTIFVLSADHGKVVGPTDAAVPQSYNHIPLIIFGPGISPRQYDGLAGQIDVMPTLLGILHRSYSYGGFGIDLLRRQRPMIFYSADNQVIARSKDRCYIYEPDINRCFCYDVRPHWQLRVNRKEKQFSPLRHYVFAMEQCAEWLYRKNQ